MTNFDENTNGSWTNGRRSPSWQWVAVAAVGTLGALLMLMLQDMRGDLKELRVDFAQFELKFNVRLTESETTRVNRANLNDRRFDAVERRLDRLDPGEKYFPNRR